MARCSGEESTVRGVWVVAALAAAMWGCDDHGHDDDGGGGGGGDAHDRLAAACDHFEYGPEVPVTATADAAGDLPDVSLPHHRYDVALADDGAGQRVAYLKFAPSETTNVWFLPSADVPLALTDAGGAAVALETAPASEVQCDAAAKALGNELAPGNYTLKLGPTDAATVSLVVHAVQDAEHHDHGDEPHHHD
jgi:hypothetical protein